MQGSIVAVASHVVLPPNEPVIDDPWRHRAQPHLPGQPSRMSFLVVSVQAFANRDD